jgi:hypothetical protein
MSKFNEKIKPERSMSYEGGKNYKKDVLEDWMNFLFSSKMDDGFYENSDTQQTRFIELTNLVIDKYGAEFAGKCAMFARNRLGMRSVSQLVAAMLNGQSFERKRDFYKAFCHRPDDMSEIFAAIDMLGGKRSHAMIRGFADYMSGLSEYNLMKYQMKGKRYNMYDLINIIHPKSEIVDDYMNGKLEAADTWEVNISTGKDSWKNMVEGNRLGYLALIRNLNNILSEDVDDEWIKRNLVDQLINEVSIKKSLVFPYQIYTAYRNLKVQNFAVITALDTAFRIACGNMPKLEGNSVIMLDVSGSMKDRYGNKSNLTIKEVGACYAAALYINGNCDFVKFGSDAKSATFKKACGPFQVIREMCENDNCGYGTDIAPAFRLIRDKKYDRIFIVSDMQVMEKRFSWRGDSTDDMEKYNDYCAAHGRTILYSFDLGNYSNQIANHNNPDVHLMTALNDNVFKMLEYVENGGKLYDYINDNYHF